MSVDGSPLLKVDNSENIAPGQAQRLSRSPHPYHRQRNALRYNDVDTLQLSPVQGQTQKIGHQGEGATYFDADHRKRRKQTSSPSDSGTEADDERGNILLGLPAPPNRLRKGLKGASNSETASPLLTPSYLDQETRRLEHKGQSSRRASVQSRICTEGETAKLKEKFTQRRRAELIRRTSETILIGVVGFTACFRVLGGLLHVYYDGDLPFPPRKGNVWPIPVLPALCGHATVVLGLYALYPLRIIYKNHLLSISKKRSPFYIHIPAAFEPAPLLYAVLIPVFIALSLLTSDTTNLLPNLVLSLATIQSKILPFNQGIEWYNSSQWPLSLSPILVSQWWFSGSYGREMENFDPFALDDCRMQFLYPLHQSLMPVLGYLTTTSLLPAELQLLSIAMINLLLHADSAQSVILQSLLWIGGLSMFVFCGKVLAWEVTLARIPSWRFRKSHRGDHGRSTILSAINDSLHGGLGRLGVASRDLSGSDSSDSGDPETSKFQSLAKHRNMLGVDNRRGGTGINGNLIKTPTNVVPIIKDVGSFKALGLGEAIRNNSDDKKQRRYTLPSSIGSPLDESTRGSLKRSQTTKSRSPKAWSLRSFTKPQATIIKWVLAFYVFAITIAIVAFPVRSYVSLHALHSQEPIGWALGYLLGDLPMFRRWTTYWDMGYWILLPKDIDSFPATQTTFLGGLIDSYGAASCRLLICLYCLCIIAVGLVVVFRLSAVAEVDTRRKVFHGMMVAMFLPTIFVDPTFVSLAFILILAVFLLLDLFRASQLPPLSKPLTYFLAPYVDGRDHRGPVIVSHIFLLIGCAIPLWLSLAAIDRTGIGPWEGWEVQTREMSMVSGVVCVGMGDAAASLIGRRYGRRRWCWSGGKSLEGSLAFAVAVILGLSSARLWLLIGGWNGDSGDSWATTFIKAGVAATGASLTEAVLTGGNDNVIVPVVLWLLVRGLRC